MNKTKINILANAVMKYGLIAVIGKQSMYRSSALAKLAIDCNGVYLNMPTATVNPGDYGDKDFIIIENFHINSHLNGMRLMQYFSKPLIIVANHFYRDDFLVEGIPVYDMHAVGDNYDFKVVG